MASPLFEEWYIMMCVIFHHISTGFILAFPAVLTPTITGNHTDIHATREEASWFTASYGMTGPICFMILPALMQMYGRKVINITVNCFVVIGSGVIALAPNITVLIIGRVIQGFAFGGMLLTCMMMAEYSHPKRRGFFITLKILGCALGELAGHGLGYGLTWRQLAWLTAVPAGLGATGTLRWPESPAWLAYKGRYEDCSKAFEYLRGKGPEAKKELKELIIAQQMLQKTSKDYGFSFRAALKSFRAKEFLRPLLPITLLAVLLQTSGCYYLIAYLIEIMVKMTGDPSKALYFTIGFDTMKIISMMVSLLVIRLFNRRTILFGCGYFSLFLLALVCIFTYLDSSGIIHLNWLAPLFMCLYVSISSIRILSISVVVKGELFPLQYRGLGACVNGIFFALSGTLTLKLTSTMIQKYDVHGMLGIYLVICLVLLTIIYFIIPETKDRTLQDIENGFLGLKLDLDECRKEQTTNLIVIGTKK